MSIHLYDSDRGLKASLQYLDKSLVSLRVIKSLAPSIRGLKPLIGHYHYDWTQSPVQFLRYGFACGCHLIFVRPNDGDLRGVSKYIPFPQALRHLFWWTKGNKIQAARNDDLRNAFLASRF